MQSLKQRIEHAKEIVADADALLICAGAGMGVDSGLPDFRGNEGFWKAYPPIKELGLSFSEMANPRWFDANPKLAWAFYGHRLGLYTRTTPHAGFGMLLELARKKNDNYFIFTSNVDGQFQKAGFSETKIYEIHGSIHRFQCARADDHGIWHAEDVEVDEKRFEALTLPTCQRCGSVARPNILMFSDWGWDASRAQIQESAYEAWLAKNKNKKIAVIEIGAGIAIPSVRLQGERLASIMPRTKLIRINPRDYQLDPRLGVSLELGGLEGIQSIFT